MNGFLFSGRHVDTRMRRCKASANEVRASYKSVRCGSLGPDKLDDEAADKSGGGCRWKVVDPGKAGLGRVEDEGSVDNGVGGLLDKLGFFLNFRIKRVFEN